MLYCIVNNKEIRCAPISNLDLFNISLSSLFLRGIKISKSLYRIFTIIQILKSKYYKFMLRNYNNYHAKFSDLMKREDFN